VWAHRSWLAKEIFAMGKTIIYTPALLEQLRRNAQRMKRDLDIPLNEAQGRIAVEHGFTNWSLLLKHCLAAKPAPATPSPGALTSADSPVAPSATSNVMRPVLALTLPVGLLTAAEVVEQGKVQMSVVELERAFEKNRFYCVVRGDGRVFPEWQFVSPVPEVLPELIAALSEHRTEIHAFMVSAQDELNELAPAEVLAGIRFFPRAVLEPSQERILKLSPMQRKQRVMEVATDYVEEASLRRGLSPGS
jgi:hypothetical protein